MKSLQLDVPHAIVVIGIKGSGKTFFAKKFSETFEAPYIDWSYIRSHSVSAKSAEQLTATIVHEVIKTRRSIVIEPDDSRQTRDDLQKLLKKYGYKALYVWVQVDADSAYSRALKTSGISDEQHRKSVARFNPPKATDNYLVISGKHTYATQAKVVLKRLAGTKADTRQIQPTIQRKSSGRSGQIVIR